MLISACVIVKNEEKNLPTWIECVKDIADEMVIVDTGSEDNTVEIAKAAGARVYYFEWVDDFSKAKNFALSKAKGEWIIFLDADEYFAPEIKKKVRPMVKKLNREKDVLCLGTPWISVDVENDNALVCEMKQIRVFRNLPNYKYSGVVHENLQYAGQAPMRGIETNLTIYHTGYAASKVAEKHKRNMDLLLKEQKKSGDNPDHWYQLGVGYFLRGDIENAKEYMKKAIESMKGSRHPYLPDAYTFEVKIMRSEGKSNDEILKMLEEGLREVPDYPDILAEKLLIILEQGNLEESERLGRLIIKKAQNKTELNRYINNTDKYLPLVHYALGTIYKAKGDTKAAKEELFAALKSYRYREDTLLAYVELFDDEPKELIKNILKLYDEALDAAFLQTIFQSRPLDAAYAKFVKDADPFLHKLAVGECIAAVKLAARILDEALAEPQSDNRISNIKEALHNLALSFLFLPKTKLPDAETELSKLPPAVAALILRYYGENLPPVQGERESFAALLPKAKRYLPKKLRERFKKMY
ncbi:MAG: glycosyltransferase family 2 protein [Selenomonadaceae bacterium]|nr:glycosyltransferase family 2 protein [Selenomonadaceae bacterium]